MQHREGDVQAATQVDEPVRRPAQQHVARRPQGLDEAVLQHQGAELRAGPGVLDAGGVGGPTPALGPGSEVRSGARAQGDRFADVERMPFVIAEGVGAGCVGQLVEAHAHGRGRRGDPGPAAPSRGSPRGQEGRRRSHRRCVRGEAGQQGAENPSARLGVGERPMDGGHLDAQAPGQGGELALSGQRGEPARHGHRTQHRWLRPGQAAGREGRLKHSPVEGGRVGDEDALGHPVGELGEHGSRSWGALDHGLADPGEALDASPQGPGDRHQRAEAIVQLPTTHQDRPDLGQLAIGPRPAVGLDVDDEKLRAGQRLGEQLHSRGSYAQCPTACTPSCRAHTAGTLGTSAALRTVAPPTARLKPLRSLPVQGSTKEAP